MTATTVEIPDDVRDNSVTVTDYAFRRDLAPDKGVRSAIYRDGEIHNREIFGYDWYTWRDTTPDGQRCRVDWFIRRSTGKTVYFFHTEYFTRVPCCTHDAYYASHYASVTDSDGVTTIPAAYCHECMDHFRCSAKDSGMTVNESEPLRI